MKKALTILLAVASTFAVFSCRESEPEFKTTDKGPSQNVTYDASALMGSEVGFSVNLSDEIALSTLKVKLLFDETVVADTTIRTKTNGTYDGFLRIPFYKEIPNGTATLRVTSQNIQFGITEQEYPVEVSRPDFEYLTLVAENGNTYRMDRVSRYNYAVTDAFPGELNAKIVTPDVDAKGRAITFGFSAAAGISNEATGYIPFTGIGSTYEVSFNTLTFVGAPFIELTLNGVSANMSAKNRYVAVVNLTKGGTLVADGADFSGWNIDPDFLEETSAGNYKFLAASGLYKVTIQLDNQYFLIERMATENEYANIDGHAIWMIGANCYGKPLIFSAGWNTDLGLCFAEVEDNIYQITFEAGFQLSTTDINVKLFHQKGWGGEFGGADITTDSDMLIIGTGPDGNGKDSGNIFLADGVTLDMAGLYRFTVDLTGTPVLHFAKVGQNEYTPPAISFNGVDLEGGPNVFTAVVPLSQGVNVNVSNLDGVASYWWDPDFFAGGKFAAVSGDYKISVNTTDKTIGARRVNSDGSAPNLEQGGLYIQGWGVASYHMTGQVGWPGAGGYQMAQVSEGVYQMTGLAVAETDDTPGGRFRTDYISAKWFFQDGWGGEATQGCEISGNAAALVTQGSDGNLGLASNLENGATYRLTIDFTGCTLSGASIATGAEKVIFEKL
ncbi:MAG: DUF5125 domain-containing protein [Bacteroidales bacterium]|nr:DUF5125 domain-containing protein [Bacteroidales bacterium]